MRTSTRTWLAVAIAAVAVGLAVLPAGAGAAKKSPGNTAAKHDRKQDSAISAAKTQLASLSRKLSADVAALNTTNGKLTTTTGQVNTLQTLANGLPSVLTTLGNGLTALKGGLTTVGAGLTALSSFVQATEYGTVSIQGTMAGTGALAGQLQIPGCFYTTANVPENANPAFISGTCLVPPAPGGSSNPSGTLHIFTAVRGTETGGASGFGSMNPAGEAGIAYLKTSASGVQCLSTPNATFSGAPVYPIIGESPPTGSGVDAGFPFGPMSTDISTDLLGGASGFGCSGATPVVPGTFSTIQFTIRFVDLTPDDPSNSSGER